MLSRMPLVLMGFALASWSTASRADVCFDHDGIQVAPGYLPRTLVRGPGEHGSTGIDIGPDGRLWVVSLIENHVRAENRFTGENELVLGFEDGVRTPDDIAVGPDGAVYWTEYLPGRVVRRTPDGLITTIAEIGQGADGIAFSDDGRLFVNRFLAGDELYEVDPQGVSPPRLIVAGVPGMEAMDVGPDGALYIPLIFSGEVVRVDPDVGQVETVISGLTSPIAVEFDHEHRMVILESETGRVLFGEPETGEVSLFTHAGVGLDNLAFDSAGRMFVSNAMTGAIVQVRPNGSLQTVQRGGLAAPGGLAFTRVAGHLRLFVADYTSASAHAPLTGRQTALVPQTFGDPSSGLALPFTVAEHGDDLIFTSWVSNTVQVWDPNSRALEAVYTDFATPANAISFRGDLVVAEAETGSLVRLDRNTGARVTLASGLALATGLVSDGDSIWVADTLSGVVSKVVENGVPRVPPLPVAEGLFEPEGLALDRHGRLLILETGAQRLVAVHPETGQRKTIATHLPVGIPVPEGALPSGIFNGVTTDPYGHIYVSLDLDRAVLQLLDWQ